MEGDLWMPDAGAGNWYKSIAIKLSKFDVMSGECDVVSVAGGERLG